MRLILFLVSALYSIFVSSNSTVSLVEDISASSILTGNLAPEFDYSPINLLDGNEKTAWFEGNKGFSGAELIELKLFKTIHISKIGFLNGYAKSDSLFKKSGRLKKLTIVTDNIEKSVTLADHHKEQWFKINDKSTKKIIIKIDQVTHGEKYDDYGFSELYIEEMNPQLKDIRESKVKELHQQLDEYMGLPDQAPPDLDSVTSSELTKILSLPFTQLDGAGNDERSLAVAERLMDSPNHIPIVITKTLNDSVLFKSESTSFDGRIHLASKLWANNPLQVAYLSQLDTNVYSRYYRIIELGDIRPINRYMSLIVKEGIWHEFCCSKMPGDILKRHTNEKVISILKSYKNKLDNESWKDISRAIK